MWIGRKVQFKSNRFHAPMQPFAGVNTGRAQAVYMPLNGFTAVDMGYQRGDASHNRWAGRFRTDRFSDLL